MLTHTHALTHRYTHVHECAARINEKEELDASAAVYPALFLASVIQQEKMITPLEAVVLKGGPHLTFGDQTCFSHRVNELPPRHHV